MSRRALNVSIFLLVLFAAWQGFEGAYIDAKAWLAQRLLERAWTRAREGALEPRPWPWADTTPVARLRVARLGVDLIVLAGGSGRTLAFAPGHVDGSPAPGAPGTSVIAGHRDTHFRFLKDLRPGDVVEIETPGGTRICYSVIETAVADAHTQAIAAGGGRPRLALVTCYPFEAVWPGGPMRYVVLAEARLLAGATLAAAGQLSGNEPSGNGGR